MEIKRQYRLDLPYSLHDVRVMGMKVLEEVLYVYINQGFYKLMDKDGMQVEGEATIKFCGLDLGFCHVYVLDTIGNSGPFTGQKLSLEDFIKTFEELDFEIVEETYGFNKSKLSGYLYQGETIKECHIDLYHLGEMIYITEG